MTKYSTDIEIFEQIFKLINKEKFNNELPLPRILLKNTSIYGHFIYNRIIKVKKEFQFTIELNEERCFNNITFVAESLFHNMVHMYCFLNDIKDTSNRGIYHNKRFKSEVIKRNGRVNKTKYGYEETFMDSKLIEQIIAMSKNYNNKQKYNSQLTDNSQQITKSNSRKYICPCCGNSFRATKNINVICGDCNEPFMLVG